MNRIMALIWLMLGSVTILVLAGQGWRGILLALVAWTGGIVSDRLWLRRIKTA